jgi:hypothetical protein
MNCVFVSKVLLANTSALVHTSLIEEGDGGDVHPDMNMINERRNTDATWCGLIMEQFYRIKWATSSIEMGKPELDEEANEERTIKG